MAESNHTRYVSIGQETDYNTAVSEAAGHIGEVESESFQQSYDVMKRNDMNYIGSAKAVIGKKSAEGSFSMALQPDAFTTMCLFGIMGAETGTIAAQGDERAFTQLQTGDALPSYTFRIGRDDVESVFAGQVFDSFNVSASIGEYAMITFNTVGAGQGTDDTLHTAIPTYIGDAAHFTKAYVNFEGLATDSDFSSHVQSVDFEVKLNRELDSTYSLGADTCARPPQVQQVEISGSLTFHKAMKSGDASANSDPYFATLMTGVDSIVDGSSSAPAISALFKVDADDYIRFDFNKVVYEMAETSVSGRDAQTMSVNFHALYDIGSTGMMQIVIKGSDTSLLVNYD